MVRILLGILIMASAEPLWAKESFASRKPAEVKPGDFACIMQRKTSSADALGEALQFDIAKDCDVARPFSTFLKGSQVYYCCTTKKDFDTNKAGQHSLYRLD